MASSGALRRMRFPVVLIAGLLAGCASFRVVDTTPLTAAPLEPPGANSISRGGYSLASLPAPHRLPDLLVLVAMSGGGERSAAFCYGELKEMRDTPIPASTGPRDLLHELSGILGASGGGITEAYYGLYRDQMFGRYKKDLLYQNANSYIFGMFLLPRNWTWIADPNVGTNDFIERVYDRTLFHGAKFEDLQVRGRPAIAISATDLTYGTAILFTQEFFDIICSDLDEFPVARAVAASNGLPGLFTPLTLTSRRTQCGDRMPGWERRVTPEQRRDPLSRLGAQAEVIDRYLDPKRTHYVHLADGGTADNLGLRVAGSMIQNLAQSSAKLTRHGYDCFPRILVISVDGQGAQDATIALRKAIGGLFAVFDLVSGARIDCYNFETLATVTEQLREITQALRTARCARSKMIDGAPWNDVQARLVHIFLTGMQPTAEKVAPPTFLNDYPSQPVAGSSRLRMAARDE